MATIVKNPIFIPESFIERTKEGAVLYRTVWIEGMPLRAIKHYRIDKVIKDHRIEKYIATLYQVDIWGICGKLKEDKGRKGYYVAHDKIIEPETFRKIKGTIDSMFPGSAVTLF